MHLRCWYLALIDHTKRYTSERKNMRGLVPQWRTARATERSEPTARIELGDARFSSSYDELSGLNQPPRSAGRTGKFPAIGAMAKSRFVDIAVNLE
jgi:hypothetical protein